VPSAGGTRWVSCRQPARPLQLVIARAVGAASGVRSHGAGLGLTAARPPPSVRPHARRPTPARERPAVRGAARRDRAAATRRPALVAPEPQQDYPRGSRFAPGPVAPRDRARRPRPGGVGREAP